MKKLALLIPFIISSCALFGPTYTGETTASSLLKSDTERNINLAFRATIIVRQNKFILRSMMQKSTLKHLLLIQHMKLGQ